MIEKQNDPQMTEKKVITKPIDYAILNQLLTYFETRFVPQIELSAKQAFWSQYSVQTDEPNLSDTTTIVEVLKELPKVSMELFTSFDQCLIDEVTEVQNVFKQIELAVDQHREEKNKSQNKMENVLQENDRLLIQALSVKIVNVAVHENVKSACLNVDVCAHCEKVLVIIALKEQLNKLKDKVVLTEVVSLNVIDHELLKVDVASLVPKLRKNMTAHTDYIRHTQDEAATLREIVKSERLLSPLNTSLDYACKYTRRIQELLMILQQTCHSLTKLGTKLVAVTPKNKTKQIGPTEQITKLGKTTVTTPPSATLDSNTHVLSSTGVILELFTSFDQCLIDEVTEVQKIFKQMELAVEQHCAEKTKFQTKMDNVLNENDRLLTHALSVEIVNIVVHDCMNVNCLNVDDCEHCVTTESELKTDFIKKECYETLLQQYHILETHCISLEVNNQLNTEIFQRDTVTSSSESAPSFAELFETNELKAQIQEKDTVILKLKEKIKSSSGDVRQRILKH
nr:hypothetical protein [Tanacetum cinerariifolium]